MQTPAAKPGTIGGIFDAYELSDDFTRLKPGTRSSHRSAMKRLAPLRDQVANELTRPRIFKIRYRLLKIHGRRAANLTIAVLHVIFNWAFDRGFMKDNPAAGIRGIRRPANEPKQNRGWSFEELFTVLAEAPQQLRSAIAVVVFTGTGPTDASRIPCDAIDQGGVDRSRFKTGTQFYWPIIPQLRAVLDDAPANAAVTLVADGKPWNKDSLNRVWRPVRTRLESEGKVQPGLRLYGLRSTLAKTMRELRLSKDDIAVAQGQNTAEQSLTYSEGADLRHAMAPIAEAVSNEITAQQRRFEAKKKA